jgi:uncharacterized membrane protein YeaQ/YmgE (transglycosylase-associated protein family)
MVDLERKNCARYIRAIVLGVKRDGYGSIVWRRHTKEDFTMELATVVLADYSVASFIWWLVVGLIAGFLASVVMRGGGYGVVGDIIVGIIGAFLGGWLFSLLGVGAGGGLVGSIIVAFIGACILIAILRAVSGGFSRRTL